MEIHTTPMRSGHPAVLPLPSLPIPPAKANPQTRIAVVVFLLVAIAVLVSFGLAVATFFVT